MLTTKDDIDGRCRFDIFCHRNSRWLNEQRLCPRGKHQTQSLNLKEAPSFNHQKIVAHRAVIWSLKIGVSLGFGFWCLGFPRAPVRGPRWRKRGCADAPECDSVSRFFAIQLTAQYALVVDAEALSQRRAVWLMPC